MKKGFTLVELLAVITVLAVIGLIAIPTVNNAINSSKEKAYSAQIEEIKKAAKDWASDHLDEIDEYRTNYITISELIDDGYIEKEEVKNPKNDADMSDGCILISYNEKYKNYTYEYVDSCIN